MNTQSINDLPVEVISRIFVVGERMQRGYRAVGLPYVGFQDLVVQVCRHWREVAIKSPELWTHIYISRPPPCLHAELYISRSGTLPLHIDLDMRTKFIKLIHPFDEDGQAQRALEVLTFIEQAGGQRDRWGSFIVFSKALFAIISTYSFVTMTPTPALQLVSMKWKAHDDIMDVQEAMRIQELALIQTTLAHGPERPQLRRVEFDGLPAHFMSNHYSPLVSNLTRFTYICPGTMSLPSIEDFSVVLSASPRLEHLSVDMRFAHYYFREVKSTPSTIASLQVRLPLLSSISLNTSHFYVWSLHLLQIIDAPGVEYLNIHVGPGLPESTPSELYQYIGEGRVGGVLQCHTSLKPNTSDSGPIFPQLKHVNVERMRQNATEILLVFAAFPMVTHVTLGGVGALALHNEPGYLPNASHFTYIDDDTVDVDVILEFPKRRAAHKIISTLAWCTSDPEGLCWFLYREDNLNQFPYLGSERHFRLPPELAVDHLIIRRIAKETLYPSDSGDGDDEVFATFDEDDDLGFDVDETVTTDDGEREEADLDVEYTCSRHISNHM